MIARSRVCHNLLPNIVLYQLQLSIVPSSVCWSSASTKNGATAQHCGCRCKGSHFRQHACPCQCSSRSNGEQAGTRYEGLTATMLATVTCHQSVAVRMQ